MIDTTDEGQISFGMTKAPDGSGAPKVNESLFTWHGWSLAAQRPGKPITDAGQVDDSHPQTRDTFLTWAGTPANLDPNYKVASFAKPEGGTLPRLRFGQSYGVRARFVDLAGNSLPPENTRAMAAGARAVAAPLRGIGLSNNTSQSTFYLRFEPILAPSLYIRPNPSLERGDSANVVVIRKFAGKPTTETAIRHIIPPEGGESLSELHGALDDAQGKPDPTKYAMLSTIDKRPPLTTNSIISADSVQPLPYLPDITSEGATMRVVSDYPLPVLKTAFYNSDHKWPEPHCGKLILTPVTGAGATAVSNGTDMTYGLLPGQSIDANISSNTAGTHLADFNQTWSLENALIQRGLTMTTVLQTTYPSVAAKVKQFDTHQPFQAKPSVKLAPVQVRPVAKPGVVSTIAPAMVKPVFVDTLDAYVQSYIDGLNYSLTPYRMVHLVHAVQVPEPGFEMNAVVASRDASKTFAGIGLKGKVHGWSTQEVEFLATYSDDIDDLDEPKRKTTSIETKNRAFTIPIPKIDHEPINDLQQQGVHEFHDTKCHFVKYDMVIKSRYRDYFPTDMPPEAFTETFTYVPGSKVIKGGPAVATRVGQPVVRKVSDLVIIPSSRRPDPANVEYIMPLFLWAQDDVSGKKVSGRKGNLLRIFLRRPWFSSGNGERLGVVLAPAGGLPGASSKGLEMGIDSTQRDLVAHFTTVMGSDPAFNDGANAIGHLPAAENFPNREGLAKNVTMVEGFTADVAYFTPKFDDNRQMWYVDMEVRPSTAAYMPFLRLVLGRYQPNSDKKLNVEMSSLTVTDITQLQPDRLAVLEVLQAKQRVRVSIAGIQGESRLGRNVVVGTLERKTGGDPDAGWSAVKDFTIPFVSEGSLPGVAEFQLFQMGSEMKFVPVSPIMKQALIAPTTSIKPGVAQSGITEAGRQSASSVAAQSVLLPGSVDLPDPSGTYRVVLREYEIHPSKTGEPPIPGAAKERQMGGRLIHVDVLPVP